MNRGQCPLGPGTRRPWHRRSRAIGGRTWPTTSSRDIAPISSAIAPCRRTVSGRRQAVRRIEGGARPTRNVSALRLVSSVATSEATEPSEGLATLIRSESVISIEASASNRMRLRGTLASPRPAVQRRYVTTIVRSVQ